MRSYSWGGSSQSRRGDSCHATEPGVGANRCVSIIEEGLFVNRTPASAPLRLDLRRAGGGGALVPSGSSSGSALDEEFLVEGGEIRKWKQGRGTGNCCAFVPSRALDVDCSAPKPRE